MTIQEVWQQFANDNLLVALLCLIVVDLVVGVVAALKLGDFTFAKVANFARDDLLGKVVPWFAIYAISKFAPDADVFGIDFDAIQKGVWGFVVLALVGSLFASLDDLGMKLPSMLARGENTDVTTGNTP